MSITSSERGLSLRSPGRFLATADRLVALARSRGAVPADRPITPQDLASTIYDRLGLDLSTTFNDKTGRPITISSNGQVIAELGGTTSHA